MRRARRRAPRDAPLFGPRGRARLAQVLDRERFVIERERELRRDQRNVVPRVAANLLDAVREPAAVLLDLSKNLAATVRGVERLEATRRPRERADREVPSGVRADERAP